MKTQQAPSTPSMLETPSRTATGGKPDVWRRATFTDRMFLTYYAGMGAVILLLRHRVSDWPVYIVFHAVVLGALVLLIRNAERVRLVHDWYAVPLPLVAWLEIGRLNFLLTSGWRDEYLLTFEAWLFPEPPTVWLGRFSSRLVTDILNVGYLSYFLMLFSVCLVLYRRGNRRAFTGVMAASFLTYLMCYAVFITFPTEGPAHTLRHLHGTAHAGGPVYAFISFVQRAGVHGNAFPSAHMAGAVVALIWAWREVPKMAAWLAPLVMLLGIAAVYDRYHYVSDVVAGILLAGAGSWFIMFAQARPRLARRLNLVPARVRSAPYGVATAR